MCISANSSDYITTHIASVVRVPFNELSDSLGGDYGGTMEHLWVDLELVEFLAKTNHKAAHSFRLQRRVSGRSRFGLPAIPDKFNVGHYSVRPDFKLLLALKSDYVMPYVLSLIYNSTIVLVEKQQKLSGFNAPLFRSNFLVFCKDMGYDITHDPLHR